MTLEISVGPPKLVINEGPSFLVTDQDGQIEASTDMGFYVLDTRLISSWRIFADGEAWDLLNSANIAPHAARIFLTNRRVVTSGGEIPAGALGLSIGRSLGGGMHEDIDVVNNGPALARFNLEIACRNDFADIFEVKSNTVVRRGHTTSTWSNHTSTLTARYVNDDFVRSLSVKARSASTPPVYTNGRISFDVALAPGCKWNACLLYEVFDGKTIRRAPKACIGGSLQSPCAQRTAKWKKRALRVITSNEEFYRFYRQSMDDMAALSLPSDPNDTNAFVPAAGVPWFVALFGRDTLVASYQNSMVFPGFAHGSLEVLAKFQATEDDAFRDAEPGKIMHELRMGELAHFKMIPHTPYYGAADTTILYLIVLHAAWKCTGDRDLLDRSLPTAERCLSWIDEFGDRDGDGFQEYQTRSEKGYENQSWKDAGDSIVNADGSPVVGPKALCELQGYVYDAWRRMAEIYKAIGKPAMALKLRAKASRLYERFNEAFWDEESGFYALALDGEKKPVLSVSSNVGHCLWSGIVRPDRAERVVRRLMRDDMWSGWGIRTLSAAHPSYNPRSYQNGSVWPHDNGIISLGFRRYGFAAEASMIARALSDAAQYFALHQLPELFTGLPRDPTSFPVQYLGANVPQAWAAGACFSLLQGFVGYQPDAPADRLYLDPALPDWMPDLVLENLRVGRRSFDIRFTRVGAETSWEVIRGDKRAVAKRCIATMNE